MLLALSIVTLTSIPLASFATARKQSPPFEIAPLTYRDSGKMRTAKAEIAASNPYFASCYKTSIIAANKALSFTPDPVTNKTLTPPSGDKHDYMTTAPYFWADPTKPNGLPWIRRDGEVNPASRGRDTDKARQGDFFRTLSALNLAYAFSGDARYGDKINALLKIWYLDPATRVNPNINFGQAVPGLNDGRPFGIIEWNDISEVVTAVELTRAGGRLTAADGKAMEAWLSRYLDWLRTSKNGREEDATRNNHGSWYDFQVIGLMLHLGRNSDAKAHAEAVKAKRIAIQFTPEGAQPHENERTKSVDYNSMNLRALAHVAWMARKVGVDLLDYKTADGRSLANAYAYLRPYALGQKKWEHQQLGDGGAVASINQKMRPMLVFAGTLLNRDFLPVDVQKAIAANMTGGECLYSPPKVMLAK
jgi:Alginate lyase